MGKDTNIGSHTDSPEVLWWKACDRIAEDFDRELERQISGTLEVGHIYMLGLPGAILKSTGFPNVPIELSATHLSDKASLAHHPFDIGELKGLVKALQNPLGIFEYGNRAKAQNSVIEIRHKEKNFIIGVHFNQKRGNIEVSSLRGLYPKDSGEWLNWLVQGKALYIDKSKIQTLISQQRRTLADVTYLSLDSATKIINGFENPKLPKENFEENLKIWGNYIGKDVADRQYSKAVYGESNHKIQNLASQQRINLAEVTCPSPDSTAKVTKIIENRSFRSV